jgi:hypothetical protein
VLAVFEVVHLMIHERRLSLFFTQQLTRSIEQVTGVKIRLCSPQTMLYGQYFASSRPGVSREEIEIRLEQVQLSDSEENSWDGKAYVKPRRF